MRHLVVEEFVGVKEWKNGSLTGKWSSVVHTAPCCCAWMKYNEISNYLKRNLGAQIFGKIMTSESEID